MTEYWVSKKQYWCQYCNLFIRDDAPSRNHHENGLRHKGNKDRFLRNIYKTGEKSVREKEEEKKIMARIEKQAEATQAAAQPPLESSTPGPSTRRPVAKSTDPFANYSTAASLGFVDTEADVRAALEAEEEERKRIGEAGQWETIAIHEPSQAVEGEAEGSGAGYRLGSVQRENAEDAEDVRNFQFDEVEAVPARAKRRIHDVYGGDQFDPDALLRTTTFIDETKRQKEARVERETQEKGLNRDRWMGLVLGPDGKPVIKEEVVKEEATPPEPRSEHAAASAHASVDVLVPATNVKPLPDEDVKPSTSSGGLFKKRKVPVTSRSTRQR